MAETGSTRLIEPEQHRAAKVVGFSYLVTLATANFAEFYARGRLIVPGDAAQTAKNIVGSQRLFRFGTAADLLTFAGCVVLLWALYIVLKPVNRNVALLGAFFRLVESAIFAVIMLNDFATLRLLSGADYLRSFDTQQLQGLARLFIALQGSGYLIGLLFFGLGSTIFSYVWWESRYIPRALAGLGILASLAVAIGSLAIMVAPNWAAVLSPGYFVPCFLFELTMGFWLAFKGIRAPTAV
jgi:uncharacterized protein DUF4386